MATTTPLAADSNEMVAQPFASPEKLSAGRSPVILLADDEAVSRRLLSEALIRSGFEVRQAADGAEALRMAMADGVDLVVLDFEMPHLTGADICQHLRASALEHLQGLPVIMLTAHAGEAEEITCLQAGANDFVTKPVSRTCWPRGFCTQLRLGAAVRRIRGQNKSLSRWRAEHEADLGDGPCDAAGALTPSATPPVVQGWSVQSVYQPSH